MRSGFAFRLIALMILVIAAIVLIGGRVAFDSSPSHDARAPANAPGASIQPAPATDSSERSPLREPASDNASAARAPARITDVDHVGKFAAAVAAAERSGSMGREEAKARSTQHALDLLDRLAAEQARKDAVPLTSPFGGSAQDKPTQAMSGDAPATRATRK